MNIYPSIEAAIRHRLQREVGIGYPGMFTVYRWRGSRYEASFSVGPVNTHYPIHWTQERFDDVTNRPVVYLDE